MLTNRNVAENKPLAVWYNFDTDLWIARYAPTLYLRICKRKIPKVLQRCNTFAWNIRAVEFPSPFACLPHFPGIHTTPISGPLSSMRPTIAFNVEGWYILCERKVVNVDIKFPYPVDWYLSVIPTVFCWHNRATVTDIAWARSTQMSSPCWYWRQPIILSIVMETVVLPPVWSDILCLVSEFSLR